MGFASLFEDVADSYLEGRRLLGVAGPVATAGAAAPPEFACAICGWRTADESELSRHVAAAHRHFTAYLRVGSQVVASFGVLDVDPVGVALHYEPEEGARAAVYVDDHLLAERSLVEREPWNLEPLLRDSGSGLHSLVVEIRRGLLRPWSVTLLGQPSVAQ